MLGVECARVRAVAYQASRAEARLQRAREALRDLGVSIVAGSVTAIFSGVFLWGASITFFTIFAFIIVFTTFVSSPQQPVPFPLGLDWFSPCRLPSVQDHVVSFVVCSHTRVHNVLHHLRLHHRLHHVRALPSTACPFSLGPGLVLTTQTAQCTRQFCSFRCL